MDLISPVAGTVVALRAPVRTSVRAGQPVAVIESMKMEIVVEANRSGVVEAWHVEVGDDIEEGMPLVAVSEDGSNVGPAGSYEEVADESLLEELEERRAVTGDAARPEAVERRRVQGRRTARQYVAALCEEFVEYGALAIAAQRGRRDLDDLIAKTPADGLVGGVGNIDTGTDGDDRAVVLAYDFTVLAGTQGMVNHRKKDRLLELAAELAVPVVLFAEGGGGRPGDVDAPGVSQLDVPAFRLFADLKEATIGVNTGYCFAGNAALIGQCDVIVATPDSNLGMGGPAMVEGGGLGAVPAPDIGPLATQSANGVVDVVADHDDVASVVKALLGMSRGEGAAAAPGDQRELRTIVGPARRQVYDVRSLITRLADPGTFLELRRRYGRSAVTGFARVEGRAVGIVANDATFRGGAVDHDAATTIARHIRLCDRWQTPMLFLCDTPGFMVGPEAEAEGLVRSAGDLFRAAAAATVPIGTIVTRRGYGLGAMAMAAGGFHETRFTVGWPTSEFGAMGLEGAVKLGFRTELESIDDPEERDRARRFMVDELHERGKGINVASHFEIDDVIDPADSRQWVVTLLR